MRTPDEQLEGKNAPGGAGGDDAKCQDGNRQGWEHRGQPWLRPDSARRLSCLAPACMRVSQIHIQRASLPSLKLTKMLPDSPLWERNWTFPELLPKLENHAPLREGVSSHETAVLTLALPLTCWLVLASPSLPLSFSFGQSGGVGYSYAHV